MMASSNLVEMKPQVYLDPRPSEYFTRFHERARTKDPDWVYDLARTLTSIYSWTFFRLRAISAEKVPPSGPVILAPNHFSFMDHFFLGGPIRRRVRFMAKSQMFERPLQWIYSHGGVFPVRRGQRDEEALTTARTVLANGGCMAMYCEGGRSRTGDLAERAKPGIGQIALQSGAAVVPVAIHGSSHVRNWRRLEFPKITVQFGEPIRYKAVADPTREQSQAAADDIFDLIKTLYRGLESYGRAGVLARIREERRNARTGKKHAPAT